MLHAVLVGVDRYLDPGIASLRYAAADAVAMAELVSRVEPAEREITLLLDADATRRNVVMEIGERLPRAVAPGDVVLIYFAGHGSPESDPADPDDVARYLVAHDTELDHVYTTGITMEHQLQSWLARLSGPRLVMVVIDACFSGMAGGRTFEGPALRRRREGTRVPGVVSLKDLDLGEGRLIMSACGEHQVAREFASLGHGVFTHYLLRGPGQVEGATVGVHELYEKVAGAVRRHTKGRQVPVLNGRSAIPRLPRLW